MFDETVSPDDFAEIAVGWREEGAQLIGGCCGVGPDEIKAASQALENTPRGNKAKRSEDDEKPLTDGVPLANGDYWKDSMGRNLYPLPLPEIAVDSGVFVPTQGSYLIWKYLFNSKLGKDLKCLDIGCGVGILAIQFGSKWS